MHNKLFAIFIASSTNILQLFYMRKKNKFNLIFILLFSLSLAQSPEQENLKLELQWAGISYINPNVEISTKYPNFTKIEPHLRKLFTNKLKELDSSSFNLNINPSGSFKDGSLAMLLAVDSELNSKSNIKVLKKSNCLNSYYLSMQLIIFDPASSSILKIIPFNLRRPYLDDNACRSNSKEDLFRLSQLILNLDIDNKDDQQAYLKMSNDQMIESLIKASEQKNSFLNPSSLFGPIMSSIKQLNLQAIQNTNFYVGVSEVVYTRTSFEQLSGKQNFSLNDYFSSPEGFDSNSYKVYIGQQFVKRFSEEFNYPLVPFIKGRALGKDLALKFSDSTELLNLQLPELDWGFKIKIRGFKKVVLDESSTRQAVAWAAFGNITFQSVGFKDFDSINVQHAYSKEVNKADEIDDWENFDIATQFFLKNYIENINNINKDWIKKNTEYKHRDFLKFSQLVKQKLKL